MLSQAPYIEMPLMKPIHVQHAKTRPSHDHDMMYHDCHMRLGCGAEVARMV